MTRWKILDKACLAVDPNCKVTVRKDARAKVEARLDSLAPDAFEAEMAETVAFMARMHTKYLEMEAAFYAVCGTTRDFYYPPLDCKEIRHAA